MLVVQRILEDGTAVGEEIKVEGATMKNKPEVLKRIAKEHFESCFKSYINMNRSFRDIDLYKDLAYMCCESEEQDCDCVFIFDRKNCKMLDIDFRYTVEECKESEFSLSDFTGRQKRIFDNKVKHKFNTTNIYQEARYILEETAELMRAIEKDDMDNLKEELADIVIFAYGCAAVAGVGNLDDKIFEKMAINEKRVYTQNTEGDFVKSESPE